VVLFVSSSPAYVGIWDMAREILTRLTFEEGIDSCDPIWTLDGKEIVYTASREGGVFLGNGDIHSKAADGTGKIEKLASSSGRGLFPRAWSRDGKNLVVSEFATPPVNFDIGMISVEGAHVRMPLLEGKHLEKDPRISPDGGWMAYASDESGKYEVYVCAFPEVKKGKWQVSTSGGNTPLWSPDGRELYYRIGDAAMAVPIETAPTFNFGKPTVLFQRANIQQPGMDMTDWTYWDISPDGKRFLMLTDNPAEAPRRINIVVNWFEELKQRAPVQ
jgi:Tol biopolymer transport system component